MNAVPQRRSATPALFWGLVPSPWGQVAVAVDADARLVELRLDGKAGTGARDTQLCAAAATQLREYFAGKRHDFDMPLAPRGTPFQQRVWQALCAIPYGTVQSYGDVARAIGQPRAVRAVGQANGRNPIAIVIPCHRVIASDGTIGGYSGGLTIKHKLLALEGIELPL